MTHSVISKGMAPGRRRQMTYFVEHAERNLWVATMPYGTTDLAFAKLVADSIPGAYVVSVRK